LSAISVAALGFLTFFNSVTSSLERASTALLAASRAGVAADNSNSASYFKFSIILVSVFTSIASCSASYSFLLAIYFCSRISEAYF
jgi:hypothetical protein